MFQKNIRNWYKKELELLDWKLVKMVFELGFIENNVPTKVTKKLEQNYPKDEQMDNFEDKQQEILEEPYEEYFEEVLKSSIKKVERQLVRV